MLIAYGKYHIKHNKWDIKQNEMHFSYSFEECDKLIPSFPSEFVSKESHKIYRVFYVTTQ